MLQDLRDGLKPKPGHVTTPVRHGAHPQGWRVGPWLGLAAAAALVIGVAWW